MAFIQHCKSLKESGFDPKMVYRNLPPSHLYEKVCLLHRRQRVCCEGNNIVAAQSAIGVEFRHEPSPERFRVMHMQRGNCSASNVLARNRSLTILLLFPACRPCVMSQALTLSGLELSLPHLVSLVVIIALLTWCL